MSGSARSRGDGGGVATPGAADEVTTSRRGGASSGRSSAETAFAFCLDRWNLEDILTR
jgi:hypothetical protein